MAKNDGSKINLEDALRIASQEVDKVVNSERKEFCNDLNILIDGVRGLFNIHWFADNQTEDMIIELVESLQEKYKNKIMK